MRQFVSMSFEGARGERNKYKLGFTCRLNETNIYMYTTCMDPHSDYNARCSNQKEEEETPIYLN